MALKDQNTTLNVLQGAYGFSDMLAENKEILTPLSILEIITEVRKLLEEVSRIHELGRGSIMNGMLSTIGIVLKTTFRAAGSLFNTVGDGIGKLINNIGSGTAQIITGTGTGIANIVNFTGDALEDIEIGLSDILHEIVSGIIPIANTLAIILILAYLAYIRRHASKNIPQIHRREEMEAQDETEM
jgi:phage-related protein